jgi:hypothetical protein
MVWFNAFRGFMFIARRAEPHPAPFEGVERFRSGEALLEFRSFEWSWPRFRSGL